MKRKEILNLCVFFLFLEFFFLEHSVNADSHYKDGTRPLVTKNPLLEDNDKYAQPYSRVEHFADRL